MRFLSSRDHALRIAVWAVIATEAVMFAALIAVRGGTRVTPNIASFALAVTVTLALFAGSGALATAVRRVREGRIEIAARFVVLATILGFAALVFELVGVRIAGPSDALGVMIVGLHAAHVAAAIAFAAWVLALARIGRIHPRHHDVLSLVGSYWYFVAAVWVFVWPLFTIRA
jgi:heme/copper-type cytochrome/quinol oxidase subunit 3